MGTVHARVRGPATRGLRGLWASRADGRRWETLSWLRPGFPGREGAEGSGVGGGGRKDLASGQRVSQTFEQEPDTQEGRDLLKVTQRVGGPKDLRTFCDVLDRSEYALSLHDFKFSVFTGHFQLFPAQPLLEPL